MLRKSINASELSVSNSSIGLLVHKTRKFNYHWNVQLWVWTEQTSSTSSAKDLSSASSLRICSSGLQEMIEWQLEGGQRRGEAGKLQMVAEMPELLLMTFLLLSNCHGRIGGTRKKSNCSENGSKSRSAPLQHWSLAPGSGGCGPEVFYVYLRWCWCTLGSRWWSITVGVIKLTSLYSWIWLCSNMENTLEEPPSPPPCLLLAFFGAWRVNGKTGWCWQPESGYSSAKMFSLV